MHHNGLSANPVEYKCQQDDDFWYSNEGTISGCIT